MFEFANIFPLFGLSTISIIILIHLRGKKRKTVYFSTLVFFDARRTLVSRKSINLPILILQIIIAVFLVMSIAQPRTSSQSEDVIILMDLSNSIGSQEENGTRLDLVKQEARNIIEEKNNVVIHLLVFADETYYIANSTNKSYILSKIDQITVIGGRSNVDSALKRTVDIIDRECTIYLLTDGTYANIYSGLNYVRSKNSKVIARHIGTTNGSTIAIVDITIPPTVRLGTQFSISTKLLNYLTSDQIVTIYIELNGVNVSQRTVTLTSKRYTDVTFDNITITENRDNFITAYIDPSEDDMILSDNVRYRIIPKPEIIGKVLYIEETFAQRKYVESALAVNQYIAIDTYGTLDSSLIEKLGEYDLVILSDLHFSTLSLYVPYLINYVTNGSYILIAAGNNILSYTQIENFFPFEVKNIINATNTTVQSAGTLFRDVDLSIVDFFKFANSTKTSASVTALANITFNGTKYSLVNRLNVGSGSIYYVMSTATFGGDIAEDIWTNWPRKYSYPIFWQNLLDIALKGKTPTTLQKDFLAGDVIFFEDLGEYVITLPNNDTITGVNFFEHLSFAGFYQVNISNQSYYISVNGYVNEFHATPRAETAKQANDFFQNDTSLVERYENIWVYFMLIGFIVLTLEWCINWRI